MRLPDADVVLLECGISGWRAEPGTRESLSVERDIAITLVDDCDASDPYDTSGITNGMVQTCRVMMAKGSDRDVLEFLGAIFRQGEFRTFAIVNECVEHRERSGRLLTSMEFPEKAHGTVSERLR